MKHTQTAFSNNARRENRERRHLLCRFLCVFLAGILLTSPAAAELPETRPTSPLFSANPHSGHPSPEDTLSEPLTPEQFLPGLSPEPAAEWIHRLAHLPGYASAFYIWLISQSQPGGALRDVTRARPIKNDDGSFSYAYVATLSGPFSFTYDTRAYAESSAIQQAIHQEIERIMAVQFHEAVACMSTAYSAFDRDHPEVFWLTGDTAWNTTISAGNIRAQGGSGTGHYTQILYFFLQTPSFDIRAEEYRDTDVLEQTIAHRDAAVQALVSPVRALSRTEQIRYFNRWLTEHNAYNSSPDLTAIPHDTRECISALTGRTGKTGPVCEGYARAFKVLCDAAGIPCTLSNGEAVYPPAGKPVLHMWNNVCLGGRWYAVDVTWNDPLLPSSGSSGGAVSGRESETWLLQGSSTETAGYLFRQSHTATNQASDPGVQFINEPVLSFASYEYRHAGDIRNLHRFLRRSRSAPPDALCSRLP